MRKESQEGIAGTLHFVLNWIKTVYDCDDTRGDYDTLAAWFLCSALECAEGTVDGRLHQLVDGLAIEGHGRGYCGESVRVEKTWR